MKSVGDFIKRWDEFGLKSVNDFSLSNHYSILFDDKNEGFDYLFDQLEVDRDQLVNVTDKRVIGVFDDFDDGMCEVTYLIEDFVRDVLMCDNYDIEDAKNELEYLRISIENTYQTLFEKMNNLKIQLKEGLLDDEV